MVDIFKHGLVVALGFSIGLTSLPATVIAQELSQSAVWHSQNTSEEIQAMLYQTGMRAGSSAVPAHYYVDKNVKDVFKRNADLRNRMPSELPNDFNSIVNEIEDYIENETASATEDSNKISHNELARKIVRVSFCFGTDPKMSAAKIRMESVFLKTAVSPTGAVGLSQLTGIALEEVNDQLGNRGNAHAPKANTEYFKKAIRCYLGRDLKYPWTVGITTAGKTMSPDEIKRAKEWIKRDMDRDLIYGHIILKLNLAITKGGSDGTLDNYAKAFVRYNGDNAKVGKTLRKHVYSKAVMGYFQNINYLPQQDYQLFLPTTPREKMDVRAWKDVQEL